MCSELVVKSVLMNIFPMLKNDVYVFPNTNYFVQIVS